MNKKDKKMQLGILKSYQDEGIVTIISGAEDVQYIAKEKAKLNEISKRDIVDNDIYAYINELKGEVGRYRNNARKDAAKFSQKALSEITPKGVNKKSNLMIDAIKKLTEEIVKAQLQKLENSTDSLNKSEESINSEIASTLEKNRSVELYNKLAEIAGDIISLKRCQQPVNKKAYKHSKSSSTGFDQLYKLPETKDFDDSI